MSLSAVSLLNQNHGIGVTYEITNPKGVKSYLIGTFHNLDAESLQRSNFQQIVDKCSALYSEAGTNFFISSAHGSNPEEDHPYKGVKYRYYLDLAITLRAWYNNIPIVALDQEGAASQLREFCRQKGYEMGPDAFEKLDMQELEIRSQYTEFKKAFKAWSTGDIGALAVIRKTMHEDDDETRREDQWLKILMPKLLEGQKSICIAVGAAHVVGTNSISDRIEKAGCKVELITPICSTSLDEELIYLKSKQESAKRHAFLIALDPTYHPLLSYAKRVATVVCKTVQTLTSLPRSRL
jgi:uncharacterized protein YbaP (TraB family)